MGSHGIRDQVAIVGMGCTAFGEHWDKSTDDLLVESATAAAASAGVELAEIDAFWPRPTRRNTASIRPSSKTC